MLDVTHSHVDAETEFGVASMVLLFINIYFKIGILGQKCSKIKNFHRCYPWPKATKKKQKFHRCYPWPKMTKKK